MLPYVEATARVLAEMTANADQLSSLGTRRAWADRAEQRADAERVRADRASEKVQELAQVLAERAAAKPARPAPKPPRTRWRLLRNLGHVR
jgi:hypothetical protein